MDRRSGHHGFPAQHGRVPADGGRAGRAHPQLRVQRAACAAVRPGRDQLRQPVRRAVRGRGHRPGRALARQPQLEAEPFHDRPALGRRLAVRHSAAVGHHLKQNKKRPCKGGTS